ncbi:MAG: hypothetical protein ACRERV_15515, partial [Methylococcales bacterium]
MQNIATTGDTTMFPVLSGSGAGAFVPQTDSVFSFNSTTKNLGIGTATPAETLDVLGTTLMTNTSTALTGTAATFLASGNNAANTGNLIKATVSGASAATVPIMGTNAGTGLSLRVNDDGTDTDSTPFAVNAAGFVGIGTAVPINRLHIYDTTTGDAFATMGDGIATAGECHMNFGHGGATFGPGAAFFNVRPCVSATGENPSIAFRTKNITAMTINKDQNVGIAIAAPTAKLHVVGDSKFTNTSIALTGTANDFLASGDNAANTGNLIKATVSGTSAATVPIMATNAGTGLSLRINDDGT